DRIEQHFNSHGFGEARDTGNLHRPQAEAMTIEVLFNPIGQRITLGWSQKGGKVFHHAWVSIHRRERLSIRRNPPAESQPRRSKLRRRWLQRSTSATRPSSVSARNSGRRANAFSRIALDHISSRVPA